MTIVRDKFAVDISFNNKEYHPQQVLDYITNTSGEGFADPEKLTTLIQDSQNKFQSTVEKYNLKMDQTLQKETSQAGKELAEFTVSCLLLDADDRQFHHSYLRASTGFNLAALRAGSRPAIMPMKKANSIAPAINSRPM